MTKQIELHEELLYQDTAIAREKIKAILTTEYNNKTIAGHYAKNVFQIKQNI